MTSKSYTRNSKYKVFSGKIKMHPASTVLHAFCKTYAKAREREKKENLQGRVLYYHDELTSSFSLSTPYFKLDDVLKFSEIVG